MTVRILERNKQLIWFANPTGEEPVTDANGFLTGEKRIVYGEPVAAKMSMAISSGANNLGSQGMAELERYGITTGYTHRAVTEDMDCPMREESLVWYRKEPYTGEGDDRQLTAHNFKVVRKAQSLNHLIFYLKEVDVSE